MNAQQLTSFGGVDSRSNPLAYPPNRSLRLRNWVPQRAGHLELRWGYSTITMSAVTPTPIVPPFGYVLFDGTAYVVFAQQDGLKRLTVSNGTVTPLTVRGIPIQGWHRWGWANINNRLYGFNTSDGKMLDAAGILRDIGVRSLTVAEAAAVTVAVGAADASGIAASIIGGNQPGYQFFAAIMNTVTGDVGNRMPIGARVVPGVASDINIAQLPNFSGVDSEWGILIGRTYDGGESPYAVIDDNANWIVVPNGQTGTTITQSQIDATSLLPYRNAQPQVFATVVLVGDRLFAVLPNNPFVYYSESEADYVASGNFQFVGNAPTCWPLDNWELFPSGGTITCIGSDSQLLWVFTRNKMALLQDNAGVMTWQGEWDVGGAGWDAFTSTPYGPHWITGKKELATMGSNGPVDMSDEYERALLARIGDAYIGFTQIAYQRDPERNIDRLIIRCLDKDEIPFIVYHDFAVRDYASILGTRSPNGQGYDAAYSGPLSISYNIGVITDENQVKKVWAAAQNGNLYELDAGPTDGPNDFTADMIVLMNAGPNRPGLDGIEWYGDGGVQWSIGKKLSIGIDDFTPLGDAESVPGSTDTRGTDSQYRVPIGDVELKHIFIRAQLTSHGNQLLDPLFTNGNIDWSKQGTIGNDGGGDYLDFVTDAVTGALFAQETNLDQTARLFSVTPGSRMAVSVDMNLVAGDGANCLFGLWVLDEHNNLLQAFNIYGAGAVAGNWQNFWAYAVMPVGAVQCYAYFGIIAPSTECYFRNPSFRFMDDPRFTQNWNDPPHCPLETYGRLYMITPLAQPEIGHR